MVNINKAKDMTIRYYNLDSTFVLPRQFHPFEMFRLIKLMYKESLVIK